MPMTAPTIEDGVATSPRQYRAAFKSNAERFKSEFPDRESTNLQYDIKVHDMQYRVKTSPRKLAAIFAPPKEDNSMQKIDVPQYDGADTIYMNKASIMRSVQDDCRTYCFNDRAERFQSPTSPTLHCQDFYDTSTLHKKGIREALITSPRRYSVMSSRTNRQDTGAHINADYFPVNHTVQYNAQSTPRRYSNVCSITPRKEPNEGVHMRDLNYNTDQLNKASVAHEAQRKLNSRAFKSPRRQGMEVSTSAPDKMYDPDCGNKISLWSNTQRSGNIYQGMTHSARDAPVKHPPATQLDYDTNANPVKPSLAYSVLFSPRLMHNVRASTARFQENKPEPYVQAWYDLTKGPRNSGDIQKRVLESPRRYFGAQSMRPRSMDTGDNMTHHLQYDANYDKTKPLNKVVQDSPNLFSAMRSVIPRFKTDKKAATMDEYEQLLRNPDKIELKFQVRGNVVVKKTTDRALLVVGRQAPPGSDK